MYNAGDTTSSRHLPFFHTYICGWHGLSGYLMNPDVLSKYFGLFGNLHRHVSKAKGAAPHKPILLLALLDEIERGNIATNLVPITPELVASFRVYWRVLVPPDLWLERIVYPFRYLIQDGFWELVHNGVALTSKKLGDPTSLKQLEASIDGGRFASDLWQLLQDRTAINALRSHLLKTYFSTTQTDIQPQLPASPIDYEAQKLISEAQSKFRANKVREKRDEDGYFVRHALFPQVIKSLYYDSCAVCRLSVSTEKGSGIVDAAHIMPFGIFHNDDPRNGIALCKNHHWGFDAGWYTLSDEYKIVTSPHLRNALTFVTSGVSVFLPPQIQYAPALDALAWHRSHIFLK